MHDLHKTLNANDDDDDDANNIADNERDFTTIAIYLNK